MYEYILSFDNMRDSFLAGVAFIAALLFALTIHEMSHALVAKWNGDPTAEMLGRITLNPLKHLDIFGTLMMVLAGFGWAKPVPIEPRNFKNYRKGLFTVSIAGVTANLITAAVSIGIIALISALMGVISLTEGSIAYMLLFLILQFCILSMIFNATLAAFNLLPIFPLDGFRVVESLTKNNNGYVTFMKRNGYYVLFGLLIVGSLLGNFSPYLDPIGLYINFVMSKVIALLSSIL